MGRLRDCRSRCSSGQWSTRASAPIGSPATAASPANLEACGFDASSYSNPDATAQERGRDILHGFGAVVVVPRAPLDKGASYTVSMTVNGREYQMAVFDFAIVGRASGALGRSGTACKVASRRQSN